MAGRDIFIGFNYRDTAIAEALADALTRHGLSSWVFTRENVDAAGVSHLTQSYHAIVECQAVVVIASPASIHAREVVLEVQRAHKQHKPIIFVRVSLTPEELETAHPDIVMLAGLGTTLEASPNTITKTASHIARTLARTGTGRGAPATGRTADVQAFGDEPTPGSLESWLHTGAGRDYSESCVCIRADDSPEARKLAESIRQVLVEKGFHVSIGSLELLDRAGTFKLRYYGLGIRTARDVERLLDGLHWRGRSLAVSRRQDLAASLHDQETSFEIVIA